MMRLFIICLICLRCILMAENGWHLTSMIGVPKSFNNDLTLHYDNQTIVHKAKYTPKAFSDFPYWALRSEYWYKNQAIGFEIIHHKVYLANTTSEIQKFSVSDGYNLIYLNYAQRFNDHILRGGIGVIFGNPDVTLNGRSRYLHRHLKGMHYGGLSTQLSYERWLAQNDQFFMTFETKLTHSYAKLPISDNRNEFALVPDTAIHFSIGFGTKPVQKTASFSKKALFYAPLLIPNTLYMLRSHTVE